MERGLRFEIDFSGGYSVGLFIDQRENRSFIRTSAPKRMLNCFAYTCSFSVAAAIAGGNTVSVDLSQKSLERGRANFVLNNLPATGHHFIADDVFEVFPRLSRKGEKFDLIVLDPPTFSRSHRGKTFQIESDFEGLVMAALEVADRDCRILLSTNCAALDGRALEVMARYCLKTSRRAGSFHAEPRPVEFPGNRNKVMDENTDIALRGVRYAQDQFSEVVTQAEEFVREKPGQSLLIALLAGFILNRLPIGRLFGGLVRLLVFALKPALLLYGATKVYEVIQEEE
jgi:hypothetical protein